MSQAYSGTSLETQVLATRIQDIQPNSDGDNKDIAVINGGADNSAGGGSASSFTATVNPTTHILTFGGSATGPITMAMIDATHASFTRNGITTTSIDLATVVGIDLPVTTITLATDGADALRGIGGGIKFAADDALTLSDTGTHLAALTIANYKTSVLGGAAVVLDASDNTVSLTKSKADSLISSSLKFATDDAITLTATGADLSALTFANYRTSVLGGAAVVLDASDNTVGLTKAKADSLISSSLKFAADDAITLTATGTDLSALAFANYKASVLGGSAVVLDASDNTVSLTKAQADSLTSSGLKFAADDAITLADTGANLAALTFANYMTAVLGGNNVKLDASDNVATLTQAEATALVSSGLSFATSDVLTLVRDSSGAAFSDATIQGMSYGTYSPSVLGASSVLLKTDGAIELTSAHANALRAASVKFDSAAVITLTTNESGGAFSDATIQGLTYADYSPASLGGASAILKTDGVIELTTSHADALRTAGVKLDSATVITLTADESGAALADADIQGLTYASFSTRDLGGATVYLKTDGAINLTTPQANAFYSAGLQFAAGAMVTVSGIPGDDTPLTLGDGGNTIAVSGIKTLTGGAGYDTVTLGDTNNTLTVTRIERIIGGSTDKDIVILGNSGNAITVTGVEYLVGGTGTDNVTLGDGGNTIFLRGIETLTGGSGEDIAYLGDMGNTLTVTGVEFVVGGEGTDNVTLADGGNSIGVREIETLTGGAGYDTVTLGDTGNTLTVSRIERIIGGTQTDTVILAESSNALTVSGVENLAGGTGTDNVTLGEGGNTITLRGIETLTGGSGRDIAYLGDMGNTLTVTGVEVVVGGAGKDNVTLGDTGNSIIVREIETLTGGADADTVTLGDLGNTISVNRVERLIGGAGKDKVTLGDSASVVDLKDGDDTIVLGSNANVVTLGAGNDVVKFSVGKDISTYSSIVDFSIGDAIDFGLASAGTLANKPALGAGVSLSGTPSLIDYLNACAVGNGGVNALLTWFQFAGDTYIFLDCSTDSSFQAGVDGVLRIVGIKDLSHAVLAGEMLSMAA